MDNLLNYQKKLKYLSYNRGTKELDLVFSKFVDNFLNQMTIDELTNYENLINESEHLLQGWLFLGRNPPNHYKKILNQILSSFKL
jgi:succinate dehydrogenase flavin-adding protein (antitoxin of CptAB toxin-antitoxin module)